MGLSSSMWTSVSGLLAHGEKMNVISNNLANVSTIGFKSQRMDFEDFVYQDSFSGGGSTQIGFGVGINTIVTDFSQGSFESTNNATDLAISGDGFFKVVNPDTGADFYTRAGNFNFNNQGYLTLPSGEVLQGWPVDNIDTPLPATGVNPLVSEPQGIQTVGSAQDIVLDTWSIAPKATTKVEFSVNLTAEDGLDKSTDVNNPLFAMAESWNGKHAIENPGDPALSDDAYVYPAHIEVYDEAGNVHNLTCYFDQVPTEKLDANGNRVDVIEGLPEGYEVYEYLLTMDPEDDARSFGGTYDSDTGVLTGATSFQETEAAGILMKGTMIFDASGNLVSQTSYTYMSNADLAAGEMPGVGAVDPDKILEDAKAAGEAAVAANLGNIELAADAAGMAAITTATRTAAEAAAAKAAKAAAEIAVPTVITDAEAALNAAIAAAAAETPPRELTDAEQQAAYDNGYAASVAANPAYTTAYDGKYAIELEDELRQSADYQKAYDSTYQVQYDAAYNPAFNSVYYDDPTTAEVTGIEATYGHPDSALSWQPTPVSDSGYPVFTANFSGHPMGNSISQSKQEDDPTKSKEAEDILIEFDLGLQSESPTSPWAMGGIVGSSPSSTTSMADVMLASAGGTATTISYGDLATLVPAERASGASTNRGDSSSIAFSSQDGYGSGNLSNARIDANGVLYGIYNNGIEMPLYQIAMYDFVNPQGLYREGGNLYSETAESGSIQQAQAGIAGMGTINAYNIEQSNVDMSVEFVQMIVTQRGFQGNSKGITTVDTMLEQVINMKR